MTRTRKPVVGLLEGIQLALQGDGLSPADVPVRQLAELLEATAGVLEALAKERGESAFPLSLVAVKKGFAAYNFLSASPQGSAVFGAFLHAAARRGRGSSGEIRRGLHRLHRAAARVGSIKVTAQGPRGVQEGMPVVMAPPILGAATAEETSTEILGRVTGIVAKGPDAAVVRIKVAAGGQSEFGANQELAQQAAHFFNRDVRAGVTFEVWDDTQLPGELLSLEAWDNVDLLVALRDASQELVALGINIPGSEWLKELREED